MCGIVGVAAIDNRSPDLERIAIARDSLRHRGPDDFGSWRSKDGKVVFGHRRLAVIDLTTGGKQPMQSQGGTHSIVFNGEIYNHAELRENLVGRGHQFFSDSDTEVFLKGYQEWGVEVFAKLRGMFAVAIYDALREKLVLARDIAGEKPLFYRVSSGSISFASELKALLCDPAAPRTISPRSLDAFLTFGFVEEGSCILSDYRKVPPATYLEYDLSTGGVEHLRYWQQPELSESATYSQEELLEELEALLSAAVRRQLVADVPVGVLLSGGLDSSLIAAIAAKVAHPVRTYTVGFPLRAYDERQYGRLVASSLGTNHTEIELDVAEITGAIQPLAVQFDEPIMDSSMIPTYFVAKAVRAHCTVALGGDGGDELFGGYYHYSRLLKMRNIQRFLPSALQKLTSRGAKHLSLGTRGRNWLLGMSHPNLVPLIARYFGPIEKRKLLAKYPWAWRNEESLERWFAEQSLSGDIIQDATRLDFSGYLPSDLLVKVDRASMLNSLEMRAPFLDMEVVEFASAKVPSRYKTTADGRKLLLRELARKMLPPEFDVSRKQGFSAPISDWIRSKSQFRSMVAETLTDPSSIFDPNYCQFLIDSHMRGQELSERIFGLFMFERWRRAYGAVL